MVAFREPERLRGPGEFEPDWGMIKKVILPFGPNQLEALDAEWPKLQGVPIPKGIADFLERAGVELDGKAPSDLDFDPFYDISIEGGALVIESLCGGRMRLHLPPDQIEMAREWLEGG